VDLKRTLRALPPGHQFQLSVHPERRRTKRQDGSIPANAAGFTINHGQSQPEKLQTTGHAPRHESFSLRPHHYRTGSHTKNAELTDKQRRVRIWQTAALYEFSTAIKIFCTKTAQCVYAESVRHPPFTHWWGEPVTFWVVTESATRVQHDANHGVKPEQNVLEHPGFMRFLQQRAGIQKKNQQDSDLCTLVAFTPTSPLKRPLEVEALRQIKTVAGLPDGDSSVSPGTLFTDAQALETTLKVVSPLASGL